MARRSEKTRKFSLVASKSGACRKLLHICPPLCLKMGDVALFEEAINNSFDAL